MFVRNAPFCRMPVTTAPASADIRKERSCLGFCWAPYVPGLIPAGSTLLVRQRIATDASDLKRNAPAEPTGRPSSESSTSTTSRIFPAGTVNVCVKGAGLVFWLSWKATVTVAFHDNQNTNPAPLTQTFTVPAGKIRDVVDVLDSLLGLPVGSAGALRFKSDASVAILCRTSNVDPAGIKPGTYGAQQKPRQLLSFLMSADAGAVVTGIRQNGAFRTNIGFAAGADGADYALALKNTAGATVATATGSLGAFGWTQPHVHDLFPSVTIPDDATLLVRVTSGSVDVFDSSIDNASGDPVVTPIMPLPVDIPSSATIGSQGGSIRSTDGRFTLKVPAGVLSTPTAFSVVPVANDAPDGVGPAYEVTPDPFDQAGAVRVVLTYLPADLKGTGPSALRVTVDDNAAWRSLQAGAVDPIRRSITAPLVFTSASAVVSPPGRRALAPPAKRRVALFKYLYLSPDRAAILTSQSLILQIRASGPGVGLIKDPEWGLDGEGVLTPNGLTATYQAPFRVFN